MLRTSDSRKRSSSACCLALGLTCSGAALAAEGKDDASKPPRPPFDVRVARAAYVRGSFEYSRPNVPFAFRGDLAGEGLTTSFYDQGQVHRDALGGRLEAGVAFSLNDWLFLLPHGALSLARVETIAREVELVGVNQSWTSDPTWWAAMVGAELQFQRWVGISVDLGVGGTAHQVSNRQPADLRLTADGVFGVLARLGLSVRLPVSSRFGAGVTGAAEGFLSPASFGDDIRAGRISLGVFVEWDQSRRSGATP